MADQHCESCGMRAKYDNNPRSILSRLWRWHINWCPGWKGYMKSLGTEERKAVAVKYGLK
jgi:hypothetical protein